MTNPIAYVNLSRPGVQRPFEHAFVDVTYPQRFTRVVIFEIGLCTVRLRFPRERLKFLLKFHVEFYATRFLTQSPQFCLFMYLT